MLPGFPWILTLLLLASTSLAHAQPFFIPGQDPKPAGKVWAKVEDCTGPNVIAAVCQKK